MALTCTITRKRRIAAGTQSHINNNDSEDW